MLNDRALVLNRHWMPIATIQVRDALVMLCRGTADVVCPVSYDKFDLERWVTRSAEAPAKKTISTPRVALHLPEVILLKKFAGVPRRQLSFTRKNLYRRDNYTCQYCLQRKPVSQLTIDHVKPRCRGGQSSWENCVLACVACNTRKANKSLTELGISLPRTPRRPHWNPLHEMSGDSIPSSWQTFLAHA